MRHASAGVTASRSTGLRATSSSRRLRRAFVHRTGHGSAWRPTRSPRSWRATRDPRAGDGFSIEPGIYLEGRHGARIEDIVAITDDGPGSSDSTCDRVTSSSGRLRWSHGVDRRTELPDEDAQSSWTDTGPGRRELAPRAEADEHDKRFPRESTMPSPRPGCLGWPIRRITAAAGSPTRSICRSSRSSPPPGCGGLRDQRPHALDLPAGDVRHGRATRAVAARHARRPLLGAYCLSEPESGSDAASLSTRAGREGDEYVLDGTKAWITHGGEADFYDVMARTSEGAPGYHLPARRGGDPWAVGRGAGTQDGAGASPTARSSGRRPGPGGPPDRRGGAGVPIALAALDSGRLGIAACRRPRSGGAGRGRGLRGAARQFGRPIADFQGVGFMLADMATQVEAARELYLAAARRATTGSRSANGGDGEAVCHRHRDARDDRRRAGARGLRLREDSRSSATCARPRSCRSSKAPTRSSGWSSPGVCWADRVKALQSA